MVRSLFATLVALKLAQVSQVDWDRIGVVTLFAWASDTASLYVVGWARQAWAAARW